MPTRRSDSRRRRATLALLAVGAAARGSAGPISTANPTISGVALVGRTVATSNGAWTNPGVGLTFKYQRRRQAVVNDRERRRREACTVAGLRRLEGRHDPATSAATAVVATESGKPA